MTPCSLVNSYQLLERTNITETLVSIKQNKGCRNSYDGKHGEKLQVHNSSKKKKSQFCWPCGSIAQVGFSAVRRAMFIAKLNFMLQYFEVFLMFNVY